MALFYAEDDDLAEMIGIFHKMSKKDWKKLLGVAIELKTVDQHSKS